MATLNARAWDLDRERHSADVEQAEHDHRRPVKRRQMWMQAIRTFSPAWFAATMGTGIVSVLIYDLSIHGIWLYYLSLAVFALNVVLFLSFFVMALLRCVICPSSVAEIFHDPTRTMYLGTFPMGLSTIVVMLSNVCVPVWGDAAANATWALWILDAALAIMTCLGVPFILHTRHCRPFSEMTAAWLLPVVSTVVCSATGGVVAEILPNPDHALWTVIACYVILGTGLPLATITLAVYILRLSLHGLPPLESRVSVFLPLGPFGQGAFGLIQLGKVSLGVFPKTGALPLVASSAFASASAGAVFYAGGTLLALLLWGFGLVWLFFAVASVTRERFPFTLGWWGFTFPMGVFATAANAFAEALPSAFFRVVGMMLSVAVVLLWGMVASATIHGVYTGNVFGDLYI